MTYNELKTADSYVIRCDRIIDGTGAAPITGTDVLVKGSKIAGIAAEGSFDAVGAPVLEVRNATLLPGLIDMHSHTTLTPRMPNYRRHLRDPDFDLILRGTKNLREDLASGVTTLRILGDPNFIDIALKAAVANGTVEGPRLLVSGKGLRSSHGHGFLGTGADGVEGVRLAVRQNVARGADWIKFYATGETASAGTANVAYYTRAEVEAIVDEAHRARRQVAVHAHSGDGLRYALDAGVDTVEHGEFITTEDVEAYLSSGRWLDITLSVVYCDDRLAYWPDESERQRVYEVRETIAKNLSTAIKGGGKFTLGSDGDHGHFSFDVIKVVELGATPLQAIKAATSSAAEVCRLSDVTGRIAEGLAADFLIVAGDPSSDIGAVRNVRYVGKEGRLRVIDGQPVWA